MNYKQKLGYTTLGAAIMLIGMWVSPLISPQVTAQHNGVFDEIQCRKLTVVDKQGKEAVKLRSSELGNVVSLSNKREEPSVALVSSEDLGNRVIVANKQRNSTVVELGSTEYGGQVDFYNNQGERRAMIGVNKYGYGVVNTWDKNGYRQ